MSATGMLESKVAVVPGSARGIGWMTPGFPAAEGACVPTVSRGLPTGVAG